MKLTRDAWLAIGLLAALVIVLSFAAASKQQDQSQLPPLTSTSNAPAGALALKLWLRQMNYAVLEDQLSSYQPPDQAKIILALEPQLFQPNELKTLDGWIRDGGTLIASGDTNLIDLAGQYGFKLDYWSTLPGPFSIQSPLFLDPIVPSPIPVPDGSFQPVSYFVPARGSYVTYLAVAGKPVLVSFDVGKGRVILSSTSYLFSNTGLKRPGNAALLLNLLGLARQQGPVWFDEWHHGFRGSGSAVGPDNWLRYTPFGRSILFVFFVIFFALLLQGRIFGRPVPLPRELKRRGALEHVTAMANLSRLAGHRKSVLQQYHHELKRTLGWRYRLDPTLPDADYVAYLVRYNPAIDGQALLTLLSRLQQTKSSEAEMLRAAAEAARWIKE